MVKRVGYRFLPTPEELVNHFLKEKRRDPDFTDPDVNDVNIYKHHPCELPGISSYQSDDQVWYFFCTLDYKYAKSDRASRTAKGGSWKKTGKDRPVKAKDSNKPIGIKKTLVFYKGRDFRRENKTNWTMHEFHEYPSKKNPLFKGQVVVCRIERKPDKKHEASSAFDEGQPSDIDSGNNVDQDIPEPEIETQLYEESQAILPNYNEGEYDISFDEESQAILPDHIGESQAILPDHIEESQAILPNHIGESHAILPDHIRESQAILPDHIEESQTILPNHIRESQTVLLNLIEWEDKCRYSLWDVQNEFHGKEAGQSHPSDMSSSNLVTGAYVCDGNGAETDEIAAWLYGFSSTADGENDFSSICADTCSG